MNITLSKERVGKAFSSLSGEDAVGYEGLCAAAARSICSRLRRGIDYKLREAELIHAAACMAFYRYTLVKQSEVVASYKAGDISIKNDSSAAVKNAKALLDDAIGSISDCFRSEGFCFKTV